VCSKDVAAIGLLERENASILNAALLRYAKKTVTGFQKAAQALDLHCPVFITSNDGTLLSCAQAARLPIRTLCVFPSSVIWRHGSMMSFQALLAQRIPCVALLSWPRWTRASQSNLHWWSTSAVQRYVTEQVAASSFDPPLTCFISDRHRDVIVREVDLYACHSS